MPTLASLAQVLVPKAPALLRCLPELVLQVQALVSNVLMSDPVLEHDRFEEFSAGSSLVHCGSDRGDDRERSLLHGVAPDAAADSLP